MTRARDIANLAGAADAGTVAGQSLIINGDMAVAQRNSSSAVAAAGAYATVDRFTFYESTDGAYTSEQSSEAPDGFSNSVKLAVTTADTSLAAGQYSYFFQAVEAQNMQHLNYGTASAKNLTLSFWVRSSKAGTYCIAIEKLDNTRYHFTKEYSISTADTWEKKTININPDSNIKASGGAIDNDTGTGFRVGFWLASGTTYNGATDDAWSSDTNDFATSNQVNWMDSISNDFYLTGVKLEVGDTATPFQHLSYADNLQQCRRYYQELAGYGKAFHVNSATTAYAMFEFNPEMRAAPTLTATTTDFKFYSGGESETISQMNLQNATNRQFQFYLQGSGFNAGRAGHLDSRSNKFYTADAEL